MSEQTLESPCLTSTSNSHIRSQEEPAFSLDSSGRINTTVYFRTIQEEVKAKPTSVLDL